MGHPIREILCIDDDEQSLRVRTIVLETLGYHVWAESDARNALGALEDHDIAAVVMDYQMPGMNGGQAAVAMKRLRPDVPVMILSALPWLPEGAPTDAIDMFVQKGEPMKVLANRIEDMIAAHERQLLDDPNAADDRTIGGFFAQFAATLRPRKKATIH